MDGCEPTPGEVRTSRDLPPYWAILVVDAKGFSRISGADQGRLNAEIQGTLEAAFTRAGLGAEWNARRFPIHTGDGYVVVLPARVLPHLLHPLLRDLQGVLEERDSRRLARTPPLRLRAAVHVGPLPDSGQLGDGVCQAMTETHRLVDSDELRRILDSTDESVTFLAAVVSQRAYHDAVEGGYAALPASEFLDITARAKNFEERAHLHVPRLSGQILAKGHRPAADVAQGAPPAEPAPAGPVDQGSRGHVTTIKGRTNVNKLRIGDNYSRERP
jgi:hypothetical protein